MNSLKYPSIIPGKAGECRRPDLRETQSGKDSGGERSLILLEEVAISSNG
ncbi:hypothetical protein J0895_11215 [Phormidium pseudopriestleyi FRX01]|uniref:Uncharacterized protein n=1 Tax=Phormidium pseudopriestleyi FRX01 TaxID=1759528 RepID=A0ABS3FRC5_9CYAN|nr:hypothetical protein [Phormidium pseudopriestleyi]MBO0349669.1 hypothetical protein [Phormidium pseudopriestleyi FRX01]